MRFHIVPVSAALVTGLTRPRYALCLLAAALLVPLPNAMAQGCAASNFIVQQISRMPLRLIGPIVAAKHSWEGFLKKLEEEVGRGRGTTADSPTGAWVVVRLFRLLELNRQAVQGRNDH